MGRRVDTMSREQRRQLESRSPFDTAADRSLKEPLTLPGYVVRSLLDELTRDFGICLSAADHEVIEANPPTDPRVFAALMLNLDGLGDPDSIRPLDRVLRTFLGVARGKSAAVST